MFAESCSPMDGHWQNHYLLDWSN